MSSSRSGTTVSLGGLRWSALLFTQSNIVFQVQGTFITILSTYLVPGKENMLHIPSLSEDKEHSLLISMKKYIHDVHPKAVVSQSF